MTDREKLIEPIDLVELIDNARKAMKKEELSCDLARNFFIAEYLISHGVTVQKKEKKVKFLPCKCGKNNHIEWCSPGGFSFECKYCGLQSPVGRTKTEARRLWNEMVSGAEGPKEGEHG